MKSPDSDSRLDPLGVEQLFHAAAELPTREQEGFLARACGPDSRLRDAVRGLLASGRQAATILDRTALEVEARHSAFDARPALPGEFFGPYRILRLIAAGGMSFVYEGFRDDAEFHKRVAIKFVQIGIDDGPAVERFRIERRILAELEHPNIASLLDGGTTNDGVPYLVMEYVDGLPLHRYVVQHGLSRADRLQLFLQVCDAVHYAHRHLVVHRDIKPGNILVTPDGVPKLLDFGIAKLMVAEAAPTVTTIRALTPEYASPEQLMGQAITTATDIYSLGALLFELLADRLPYRVSAERPAELIQTICEKEPVWQPPGLIHGDLRSILSKALRKEPERRYLSVEQLAADVRRFLENRPVLARPASTAYYAGRFLVRNKALTAISLALVLTVLTGLAAFAWQANRAEQHRNVAQRRFDEARRMIHTVIHEIEPKMARINGTVGLRKSLIEQSLVYLQALGKDAQDNPALMRELIDAYVQLAVVSADAATANVGDHERASEILQKAEMLADTLAGADAANVSSIRTLIGFYRAAARHAGQYGATQPAEAYAHQAVRMAEHLAAAMPGDRMAQSEVAATFATAGAASRDRDAAISLYQRSLAIWQQALIQEPSDAPKKNVALMYKNLSTCWANKGDYQSSLDAAMKARALDEQLLERDPSSPEAQMALAFDIGAIGWAYYLLKDYPKAAENMRQNVELRAKVSAANPEDSRAADRLAYALGDLTQVEKLLGDRDARRRDLLRTIDLYARLSRRGPLNLQSLFRFASSEYALGGVETEAGVNREGCNWFRKAAAILDEYERRRRFPDDDMTDVVAVRRAASTCRP